MSGDYWPSPTGWWPTSPWGGYSTCNCACQRCMAGSCCQFGPYYPTVTTTGTGFDVAHSHRWQAIDTHAGVDGVVEVIQSCECGTVRRVPVP